MNPPASPMIWPASANNTTAVSLPLCFGFYNAKLKHSGRDTAVVLFALAGQIMGLAGGLILRYVVLTGGQLIF